MGSTLVFLLLRNEVTAHDNNNIYGEFIFYEGIIITIIINRYLQNISNVFSYRRSETFGFIGFKYLQRKGKEERKTTFFSPPPRQPTTASNQHYLYRYAVCIHTRALHIVMWRWQSDWMAHSINIENENLSNQACV